jgi:hypothetical protein
VGGREGSSRLGTRMVRGCAARARVQACPPHPSYLTLPHTPRHPPSAGYLTPFVPGYLTPAQPPLVIKPPHPPTPRTLPS